MVTVLLLTGIKEELQGTLDSHPFVFEKDLRIYRSESYPHLYARTTGPGLQKRAEIEKVLEDLQPNFIVNAGLVGILREKDDLQPGDSLSPGTIIQQSNRLEFPGGPGRDRIISVEKPVHDYLDKLDLYDEFKARACDMEAAKLLTLAGSMPAVKKKTYIVFVKVAGDRPEDSGLYENEHLLWGHDQKPFFQRMKTALSFPGGPLAFRRLRKHKEGAIKGLDAAIRQTIIKIIKNQGVAGIKGVFIPY